MLQALACQGMGNMDEAFSYLARSLALAQYEGFLRTYLEVGARLEDLLRLGKEQGIWQTLGFSPFTDTLLEAF
jgi:hypothetical protein